MLNVAVEEFGGKMQFVDLSSLGIDSEQEHWRWIFPTNMISLSWIILLAPNILAVPSLDRPQPRESLDEAGQLLVLCLSPEADVWQRTM